MKKITVQNPSALLLSVATIINKEYVRTCHSDTCSCASHDSGYDRYVIEVPSWLVIMEYGGSPSSHASTGVDTTESIRAAKLAGEGKSREAGLLQIANAKAVEATRQKAIEDKKARREAFKTKKKAKMDAWRDAGLNAEELWEKNLKWAHEDEVINLAATLKACQPFVARSHAAFTKHAGFPSPLSFPRTEVAMIMAWGKLPTHDDWRDVAAKMGVTVRTV